jgi:hypothetical protein
MPSHPSRPGAAEDPDVDERGVLLGVSRSLPLAVAAATAYAVVCTVVAVGVGEMTATVTRSVFPYEQARGVVVAGLAVGAGVVGEPVLRRLRMALTRHLVQRHVV